MNSTDFNLPDTENSVAWRNGIAERRVAARMSKAELARRSGIAACTITNIENTAKNPHYLPFTATIVRVSLAVEWSLYDVAATLDWDSFREFIGLLKDLAESNGYTLETGLELWLWPEHRTV